MRACKRAWGRSLPPAFAQENCRVTVREMGLEQVLRGKIQEMALSTYTTLDRKGLGAGVVRMPNQRPQQRELTINQLSSTSTTANENLFLECATDAGRAAFWGSRSNNRNIAELQKHEPPFRVRCGCIRFSKAFPNHDPLDSGIGDNRVPRSAGFAQCETVLVQPATEISWDCSGSKVAPMTSITS